MPHVALWQHWPANACLALRNGLLPSKIEDSPHRSGTNPLPPKCMPSAIMRNSGPLRGIPHSHMQTAPGNPSTAEFVYVPFTKCAYRCQRKSPARLSSLPPWPGVFPSPLSGLSRPPALPAARSIGSRRFDDRVAELLQSLDPGLGLFVRQIVGYGEKVIFWNAHQVSKLFRFVRRKVNVQLGVLVVPITASSSRAIEKRSREFPSYVPAFRPFYLV